MINEIQERIATTANELAEILSGSTTDPDATYTDAAELLQDRALEVEYIASETLAYRGARVYVTLGGPTIFIDTTSAHVVAKWGTARYSVEYVDTIGIDAALRDHWIG